LSLSSAQNIHILAPEINLAEKSAFQKLQYLASLLLDRSEIFTAYLTCYYVLQIKFGMNLP
jgi:hypothetical protein